jgi:succinoglycan biosynthesis protein ExoA
VSNWPDVAVIMPVLNEEKYLAAAVQAILDQNYPGKLRIVLAIGPSKDQTKQIAEKLVQRDSRILITQSPTGRTPDSLNIAIASCTEEIIVRVDAHAELSRKYIETAIETLERTGADNVGGIMAATGVTNFEKAVAAAMTSPLGVGNAAFHTGGVEGPADSVYLGVFRRTALSRVGGYDSEFTRAQDWEMNFRIRNSGGLVWFNPNLSVTYRPRSNITKLAKQYFDYGTWRREVMRQHPETRFNKSALRYYAPPLAVVGIDFGLIFGFIGLLQNSILKLGFMGPFGFVLITLASTLTLAKKAKSGAKWLAIVLPTMQLSWGVGFLYGRSKRS